MGDVAVSFLLEKLSQMLIHHTDLISGADVELEQLKEELRLLKSWLGRASEKLMNKEEHFKEFERQTREAIYDAEDTIDSCLTQAAAPGACGNNFLCRYLNPKQASLAKQVKFIREKKVTPMFERAKKDFPSIQNKDLDPANGQTQPIFGRVDKVPTIGQDRIVGFEDEVDTITRYLIKEDVRILSIVGMPGLGKTTLAWKIFHNPKIVKRFPTRLWVDVSQTLNRKDVLVSILKQMAPESMSSLTDNSLSIAVDACLGRDEFFLVLDDVGSVKAWNVICDALPNIKSGRILITSRDRGVGKLDNVFRKLHELRPRHEWESWELIQSKVYGRPDGCPLEMKETQAIGKQIARKCDGLPLALVLIGGILFDEISEETTKSRTDVNAWRKVLDNLEEHFKDMGKRIEEVVSLSYNKLPSDLKDCFLYLGMFPEDFVIPASTLTQLWIAEGFIPEVEGQNLEKTAHKYLKDLIDKNLVKSEKRRPDGEVRDCRIHDVIRQFCKNKAAMGEQNLFQHIKMHEKGVFDPPLSNINR